MNLLEILLLALVVVVAAAIFVVILRNDARTVQRGTADAEAKGEPVKKRPPLGVIYFAVWIAFVIVGIFTLIGQH
jgi:ABC-type Fe3+ transport system permease subunit